ncbi:19718_t:CDS:1, partial [Cetraspora pellucida]
MLKDLDEKLDEIILEYKTSFIKKNFDFMSESDKEALEDLLQAGADQDQLPEMNWT